MLTFAARLEYSLVDVIQSVCFLDNVNPFILWVQRPRRTSSAFIFLAHMMI